MGVYDIFTKSLFLYFWREKTFKIINMRVEIDTVDLAELVKQFLTRDVDDSYLLENIEEMVTYRLDDFKHDVDIVEF